MPAIAPKQDAELTLPVGYCPACRAALRLVYLESHPMKAGVDIAFYECAACHRVELKELARKAPPPKPI